MREYTKRMKWKLTVKETDIKDSDPIIKQHKESQSLLAHCQSAQKIIALDERGKNMTSRELAQYIGEWQQQGVSHIAIMIGGADGLTDEARKKADLLLSFGKLTWPHMLVRVMLAEQFYRAAMILENHPYHRD